MSLVDPAPRRIGSLERRSTPIAFGCWRFTDEDPHRAKSLIAAALDAGIVLIDTADVYGLGPGGTGFGTSESILGGVLAGDPSLRDRMILATKGGITPPVPYDSSPSYLRSACEASLRRLHTDDGCAEPQVHAVPRQRARDDRRRVLVLAREHLGIATDHGDA